MKLFPKDPSRFDLIQQERSRSKALPQATILFLLTAMVLLCGMTLLYSTSFGVTSTRFFLKQIFWCSAGLLSMTAIILIGYRRLCDWSLPLLGFTMVLLLVALCFSGTKGGQRWIPLPGGVKLQPSEFTKVTLALFLAKFLSSRTQLIEIHPIKRVAVPCLVFAGAAILLVLKGHDLGTTVLLTMMTAAVFFVAGIKWYWLAPPLLLAGTGAFFVVKFFDPVRWARLTVFMDPEKTAPGTGYQLLHSQFALGSGGWTGVGFTKSRMKMDYIPEAHTDFILAIVGEELGYIALLLIIIFYIAFVFFSYQIAINSRTRMGLLLAFALATFIGLQAFINIGAMSGAIPTKGMGAPFISYGGSSLLSCMSATALILSVSLDSAYPDYAEKLHRKIMNFFNGKKKPETAIPEKSGEPKL